MAIPTRKLTLTSDAQSTIVEGLRFTIRLDRDVHYQGEEVPGYFELAMTTTALEVDLAPNVLIDSDSHYVVCCYLPNGHRAWRRELAMPDADYAFPVAETGGTTPPETPAIIETGFISKPGYYQNSTMRHGILVPEVQTPTYLDEPADPLTGVPLVVYLGLRWPLQVGDSFLVFIPDFYDMSSVNYLRLTYGTNTSGGSTSGTPSWTTNIDEKQSLPIVDSLSVQIDPALTPVAPGKIYRVVHVGDGVEFRRTKLWPQLVGFRIGTYFGNVESLNDINSLPRVAALIEFDADNVPISTGAPQSNVRRRTGAETANTNTTTYTYDGVTLTPMAPSDFVPGKRYILYHHGQISSGALIVQELVDAEDAHDVAFLTMINDLTYTYTDIAPSPTDRFVIQQYFTDENASGTHVRYVMPYLPMYMNHPTSPVHSASPRIQRYKDFSTKSWMSAAYNGGAIPADVFKHGVPLKMTFNVAANSVAIEDYDGPELLPTEI